jgi:hypothetical protein
MAHAENHGAVLTVQLHGSLQYVVQYPGRVGHGQYGCVPSAGFLVGLLCPDEPTKLTDTRGPDITILQMGPKRTVTDVHEYGPCPGTTTAGFLQALHLGPLLSTPDLWRFSSVQTSLKNSRDATEVIRFEATTTQMLSRENVRALLVVAARLPKLRVFALGFSRPGPTLTQDMRGYLRDILAGRHLREFCVDTVQMATDGCGDAAPLNIPKQLRIWKLLVHCPTHWALDEMWKLAACD